MIIYLASPYSATEQDLASFTPQSHDLIGRAIKRARYQLALRAQAELLRAGAIVYGPIACSHPLALDYDLPGDWRFWSRIDLAFIDACAEVWVLTLDGWDRSVGVRAEIKYALAHGKAVRYIDPNDVTAPLRNGGAP